MAASKCRKTATLLLTCPDRKGLVAAISNLLFKNGANILHADQHEDQESGSFLMRVEFDLETWETDQSKFRHVFQPIADEFQMNWRIALSTVKPRVAILVSHYDHCLTDLLYRYRIGELNCEIAFVIGNHSDTKSIIDFYGIPFHMIAIKDGEKEEAERKQLYLLHKYEIDLIVLARYMQILSPEFVRLFPYRIINIHHSFLPAFIGARPYHQAYAKGVKLIGATSHYVTQQLDEGPIIHQDVIQISHRDQVSDLIRKGRDLEKLVLSRAVKWHLENRIVVYNNKTVIFD